MLRRAARSVLPVSRVLNPYHCLRACVRVPHTHTHTHTHTHSTHARTRTHTHALSLSLSLSHTHTQTHTQTHTHTLIHALGRRQLCRLATAAAWRLPGRQRLWRCAGRQSRAFSRDCPQEWRDNWYASVCSRMLTYARVCSRMLTYAHVC